MLEALRAEVLEANLELVRRGLVIFTFGNASAVSREHGLCVIKPSGVAYEKMTAADMVITDLEGRAVEGELRPSSDLADARRAVSRFSDDRRGVYTHSRHATAWAQANREIPCFGTTHADYFPRRHSDYRAADPGGNRKRVRKPTPVRRSSAAWKASTPALPAGAGGRARSLLLGANRRRTQRTAPGSWKR